MVLNFYNYASVSLCIEEKLEVQGNAPVKLESGIARCIWESLHFFESIFRPAYHRIIKLFSPTVKPTIAFLNECWGNLK